MIFLLRREFGISAREALTVLPEWELDLLLEEHADEVRRMGQE